MNGCITQPCCEKARRSSVGCGVAQSSEGCGVIQIGCGVAQFVCGEAQLRMRRNSDISASACCMAGPSSNPG
jgi:hypothetical protein